MAITRPVKNAGEKYINGLNLSWASATTLTIAAGQCRNSSNINDIVVGSALTLNSALTGAGGLDQGSMANNDIYAVYVIGSSYNSSLVSSIISTDHDSPLMPSNYDMYRRVGFVRTNGSAQFLLFHQIGNSADRWMYYDVSIATDITAGASATFADVDCTGSVPLINTIIDVDCTFTPTAADDPLWLRADGSAAANGQNRMSGSAAGVVKIGHMTCPCLGDATLEYKVTGSAVALNVQGYLDSL